MFIFFPDCDTYDGMEGSFLADPDEDVADKIVESDKPRHVLEEYGDRGDIYDLTNLLGVFKKLEETAPDAVALAVKQIGLVKFNSYNEFVEYWEWKADKESSV